MSRASRAVRFAFVLSSILAAWAPLARAQAPLGTAFTYQGRLVDGAGPANGTYDIQFKLFDAVTVGAQVGATVTKAGVTVSAGLFTTSLDFGPPAFSGSKRWLEIGVKAPAAPSYTLLAPRQELTPSPNAVFAASAGTVAASGVNTAQIADGAVTSVKLGSGAVTSAAIASGQVVKSLNGLTDTVTLAGAGGITVSSGGGTLTVGAPPGLPSGAMVVGLAGDTTLIGAGFTEMTVGGQEFWTATSTAGAPLARDYQIAVWTGTRMIVWGGQVSGGSRTNTGGQYDPVADSWTPTAIAPGTPSGRQEATAVWTGMKMIIWGGWTGAGACLNTGGQYDPVGDLWTPTSIASGVPDGRCAHTAIWTGAKMIVWGGAPALDTGGRYDPVLDLWTATATTPGVPTPRFGHAAVWTGTRMIIWGGNDGSPSNTGSRYDPVLDSWTPVDIGNAPLGRFRHTAVWTGTRMIVWGGQNGGTPLQTGGEYDPAGDSWTATAFATANMPNPRFEHSAIWTGRRMIVWGGRSAESGPGSSGLNSGAQYDPVSRSWSTMSITGAASGRYRHNAFWTGSRMIIWGSSTTNDGGQWVAFSYFIRN